MPCLKENSLSALFVLLCFLMCDGINSIEYPMGVVKPVKDRIVQSNCETKFGQPNQVYYGNVSQEKPAAFVFYVPRDYIQKSHTTQLRIEVSVDSSASLHHPVLFAIRQQRFISTMEVPFSFEYKPSNTSSSKSPRARNAFYHSARTLCIDNDGSPHGRNVTVRVTTQSWASIGFSLILKITQDIQLRLGRETYFDVGPTTPKYFRFSFSRPDLRLIRIRATSESTNCMTMSVQTVECPIYDLEHNVRYQGLWQTMSTSAAMTVEKRGLYKKGFVLVFVAHTSNEVCGRRDSMSHVTNRSTGVYSNFGQPYSQISHLDEIRNRDPRIKTIKLMITDESKIDRWIILLCLLLPIFVTLLVCLVVLGLFRNRHEWMVKILRDSFRQDFPLATSPLQNNTIGEPDELDDEQTNLDVMLRLNSDSSSPPVSPRVRPSSTYRRSGVVQRSESSWKADLYIADFKCKGYLDVKKFAKRFYWTIAIVAIFYSIPVYQLVLHYLRVLYRTGEYDICYYNYLCAQRLGLLIDFNHFWSNASYVIFGFLFIAIIRRRSQNLYLPQHHKKRNGANNGESGDSLCCCCCSGYSPGKVGQACFCTFSKISFRWDHGVPVHFGVFYALGVALAMEGFLSAAYHLCPNQSTFQFDTCFMYVIAVLLLLKVYQFRHPVHFGANHTFAILAGFVVISVLGLLFERGSETAILIFKCVFLSIQYILMMVLCIYYYAVGYIKDENGEIITDWSLYKHLGQLKGKRINADRLYHPLISFLICIAVLVYSELSNIGFASYLLYVLVGNVLGTTLYYVGIMKPLHGEFKNWTWVQPTLYFVAAGIIGGFSLQYFVRAPAQWELSASESRAENEDCLAAWFPFHPFYDSHDAWHFLSAAALFLAFMGLLIVDDDLITTHQSEIPVF